MKKVVFTVAGKRLEVELQNDFAKYVNDNLSQNNIARDRDNDVSQLLQLYLKALHKEYHSEEQIKILLNDIEASS